jgi:hypothetical protein
MYGMLICILCMISVMEMLWLRQGNTSIIIQIEGNPRDMCLQWYTAVESRFKPFTTANLQLWGNTTILSLSPHLSFNIS